MTPSITSGSGVAELSGDGANEKAGAVVGVLLAMLATVPNGVPAGVVGRPDPNCVWVRVPNTGLLPPKTLVAGAPNDEPNIAASDELAK